jgi:hypothetical protein
MIRPDALHVHLLSVLCTNCDRWADNGDTLSLYPSGQSENFVFAATERILLKFREGGGFHRKTVRILQFYFILPKLLL